MKSSKAFALAGLLILPMIPTLAEESDNLIRASKELNRMGMTDWSEKVLKQALKSNPSDVDLVKIQLAVTYFSSNKEAEGNALIQSIPTSNPYYADAQKELGLLAFQRGKIEDSLRYLQAFRRYYIQKLKEMKLPTQEEYEAKPETQQQVDNFKKVFERYLNESGYLVEILKQSNNTTEMENVLEEVEAIQQRIDQVEGGDDYWYIRVNKGTTIIETALKKRAENLSGWENSIHNIIKEMEPLIWKGAYLRHLAVAQLIRANALLGRFGECDKWIKDYGDRILASELDKEVYPDAGTCPSANYRHSIGFYWNEKALKATAEAEKLNALAQAASSYYNCVKKNKNYVEMDRVVANLIQVAEELKKMGKPKIYNTIMADADVNGFSATVAMTTEIKQFIQNKKYAEALPLLLQAYRKSPTSEDVISVLGGIIECYNSMQQFEEALAFTHLISARFPDNENSIIALYNMGNTFWVNTKGKNEEEAALLRAKAVTCFSQFLKLSPGHPNAPAIALMISKDSYKRAVDLGKISNASKNPQEKIKLQEKSKELFLEAANDFQIVVDNFRQKPAVLTDALYFQGHAYASAEEYEKSNKSFKDLIKISTDDLARLAIAKSTIGYNYYLEASDVEKELSKMEGEEDSPEKEALIAKKKELYLAAAKEWEELCGPFLNNELKNSKSKDIEKNIVFAKGLIGWALNGAGEKTKAISALKSYIESKPDKAKLPAPMLQLALLYSELEDQVNAGVYFEQLMKQFPEAKEAKDAPFMLGRSMYNIKNYEKAISAFSQLLKKSDKETNIAAWRWILKNMSQTVDGKTATAEMAAVALEAGELLLKRIDSPNIKLSDWYGTARAKELESDPALKKKELYILKEYLWLDCGKAAMTAQDYKMAKSMFSKLIDPPYNKTKSPKEPNYISPFLFDALILRGQANTFNNDFAGAHKDMALLASRANPLDRFDLKSLASLWDGKAYVAEKNYTKASQSLFPLIDRENLAVPREYQVPASITDPKLIKEYRAGKDKENREEIRCIEEALYLSAYCAAITGLAEERDKLVKRYHDNFKQGRYIEQIKKLPAAEAASKP